jgi:hypothetical protein
VALWTNSPPPGHSWEGIMDEQPFVDHWPVWDEPLSKITAAFDVAAAREKLARKFNRRPVRLSKEVEVERAWVQHRAVNE